MEPGAAPFPPRREVTAPTRADLLADAAAIAINVRDAVGDDPGVQVHAHEQRPPADLDEGSRVRVSSYTVERGRRSSSATSLAVSSG